MSNSLQLDTNELLDLYKDLLHIDIAFGDASSLSQTLQDAIGHSDLDHRVEDFAKSWDDRRADIVCSLDTLWQATKVISTTFSDIDSGLSKALTGAAQSSESTG